MARVLLLLMCFLPSLVLAMGEDDPLLAGIIIEEFEVRENAGEDNARVWDVAAWIGRDMNKFTVRSEGEQEHHKNEDEELRLQYSRAVAPYWDIVAGVRLDQSPGPHREWLEIGVQGTAPWFIDLEASLFIGEDGRTGLRLELEREFMITQRWVLIPALEADFYGQNDEALERGSGLSHIEAGIRIGYEVRKEFIPYVGLNWERSYGNTADMVKEEGEAVRDTQIVFGFHAWY